MMSLPDATRVSNAAHFVRPQSRLVSLLFATLSLTRPSIEAIPDKSVMAFPTALSSFRFVKHSSSAEVSEGSCVRIQRRE